MGIKHNGYDFEKRLDTRLKLVRSDGVQVLTDTALEVMRDTVMETPVDSGALRGNWRMGKDKANTSTDESHTAQQGYDDAKDLVESIIAKGDDFILLSVSNNLPYASIVEYGEYPIPDGGETEKTRNGYSKLAPTGMFRRNLRRFDTIAKKHAARNKRQKR